LKKKFLQNSPQRVSKEAECLADLKNVQTLEFSKMEKLFYRKTNFLGLTKFYKKLFF
jgi:hypothetical protein